MERCLKKLVLGAETTGFQDPARTARSPQRERLFWKGSVGGQWVYILDCRKAKKLIPNVHTVVCKLTDKKGMA